MKLDTMYDAYKAFLLSDDLVLWIDWVKAIEEDDLSKFLMIYDANDSPFNDVFDPIEVVIAYNAQTIYDYFLKHEDYSHFYNRMDFSLLIIFAVFDRHDFLQKALNVWSFDDEDRLWFYQYCFENKDDAYIKTWFKRIPVKEENLYSFLKLSLIKPNLFREFITSSKFSKALYHEELIYEIISFHPALLDTIQEYRNVSSLLETDAMHHVFQTPKEEDFIKIFDFLLARGLDVNAVDAFGLPLIHLALRHASLATYVDYLLKCGASLNVKTLLGYPSAHQLMMRDAGFTLEVSHSLDLSTPDHYGLTLADYDAMELIQPFVFQDILKLLECVFNLEPLALEELDEDEFFDLASIHRVSLFTPYLTVMEFENKALKDLFIQQIETFDFDFYDTDNLSEMFQSKFNHVAEHTIQILVDIADIDPYLEELKAFSARTSSKLILSSEGYEINQTAQLLVNILPNGTVEKRATIHSHLIDVYFIHKYYFIPLEGIEYAPLSSRNKRYLH